MPSSICNGVRSGLSNTMFSGGGFDLLNIANGSSEAKYKDLGHK